MSTALITLNKGDLRNRAGIANYTKHWEKDLADETPADAEARKEVYTEVVNGYYDGATELYEMGWAESFHFARYYKGEAFHQALARHEHYLAAQMNLRPGMRVLDVGCGVGGPAREIARFADVEIVGSYLPDYSAFQLGRAQKYTARAGLSEKVTFVKGDFMALAEQFGENSFDAVYAIEATCHAPDWERCYNEIRKVLKPGGVFGVYEWCMSDSWDPKNPEHVRVQKQVELGNGIPEMRPISSCRTALQNVGFEILHEENLADRPDDIKWYYPLEGDLRKCQTLWDVITCWRMTRVGKFCTQNTVWGLEKIGLVPKGTYDVGEALKTAAVGLVEGGQKKLFTPMMLFVCRKPELKD